MKKGKAFTLAEVLITLGIIGVVAAMTIPTLVQNYQKRIYESKFKMMHSKLIEVSKLIKIDQGIHRNTDLDLSKYLRATRYTGSTPTYSGLTNIDFGDLGFMPDCTQANCYQLPDGAIISMSLFLTDGLEAYGNDEYAIDFKVDLNGTNPPNTNGRDWFGFRAANDGTLYGYGQKGIPKYSAHGESMSAELNDGMFFSPHWSQNCNPNTINLTLKDYITGVEGMPEDEFDSEWGNLSEDEKKEMEESYKDQIQEANLTLTLFASSGSNCSGRIIEKGKMDY